MNTIDVRQLVEDELKTRWSDFESQHPQLARVLSQRVLTESMASSLASESAFQQAMADASGLGNGLQVLRTIVGDFITTALNLVKR